MQILVKPEQRTTQINLYQNVIQRHEEFIERLKASPSPNKILIDNSQDIIEKLKFYISKLQNPE